MHSISYGRWLVMQNAINQVSDSHSYGNWHAFIFTEEELGELVLENNLP